MSEPPDVEADAVERLKCRDEVLQVLFWLIGERFERDMTIEGVARFVARPAHEVGRALQDAIDAGLVTRADGERYEPTAAGRREGGRRFTEEFAEMFARDTHGGTCTDPFCDCHESPQAAGACRSHGHAGHSAG
jgi:hypothetical protein